LIAALYYLFLSKIIGIRTCYQDVIDGYYSMDPKLLDGGTLNKIYGELADENVCDTSFQT
jgi:hypothetical protein